MINILVIGSNLINEFITYLVQFVGFGFVLAAIPSLLGWFINWVFNLLRMT